MQVMQPLGATMAIQDLDEKIAARKALIAPEGGITKGMRNVEALVASCTSPFYCGDKPTLADCIIFVFMSMIRSGCDSGCSRWQ